jgi:hypothetical protein
MSDAPTLSPEVSRSVLALAVVEAVDPDDAGVDPLKYM